MSAKPPKFFWFISIIALLWNVMGCFAYLMQRLMTDEMKAALPAEDAALYAATPEWANSAFAIAVWAGLLASILLLLRKSLAVPLFIISLLGIVAQQIHMFFISDLIAVKGLSCIPMPVIVLIIGLYLIQFSNKAKTNNWIQ